MNKSLHKFCIYSAGIMVGLFTVAVLMAHLFPPPSPLQSAHTVGEYYRNHQQVVRIGLIVGSFAAAFMGLFTCAIAYEVRKMTGRRSMAANIQLVFGIMFMASLFFPFLIFQAATFRVNRPDAVIQGINDTAWIMFVAPVSVGVLELLFLGWAILQDKRAIPTFPRWFGYYTLFVGFDFAGGGFCVLAKTGPFAWNGVLSYYLPFVTWGGWVTGMMFYMVKSVDREYSEHFTVFDEMPTEERVDALSADVAAMRAELARLGAERATHAG